MPTPSAIQNARDRQERERAIELVRRKQGERSDAVKTERKHESSQRPMKERDTEPQRGNPSTQRIEDRRKRAASNHRTGELAAERDTQQRYRESNNENHPDNAIRQNKLISQLSNEESKHLSKQGKSSRKATMSPRTLQSPHGHLQDLEGGKQLARTKSLVRPERARRHNLQHLGGVPTSPTHFETDPLKRSNQYTPWITFAYIVTFYAPDFILRRCGMKEKRVQVAWREKMALVTIIVALCAILAFITFGFQASVCGDPERLFRAGEFNPSVVNIRGDLYDVRNWAHPGNLNMDGVKGRDVSWLFPIENSVCPDVSVSAMKVQCTVSDAPDWAKLKPYCHTAKEFAETRKTLKMVGHSSYTWEDVQLGQRLVFNNMVVDLSRYFSEGHKFLGPQTDLLIRSHLGRDATVAFIRTPFYRAKMACLLELFKVGILDSEPMGCIASNTLMYASLFAILTLVFVRFVLAVGFSWIQSRRLGKILSLAELKNQEQMRIKNESKYATSTTVDSNDGNFLEKLQNSLVRFPKNSRFSAKPNTMRIYNTLKAGSVHLPDGFVDPLEMHAITLVTCYSEGQEALKTTLDSVARSDFPLDKKLLVIISDGLITGSGNAKATPDLVQELLEMHPCQSFPVQPKACLAIADGKKRFNMAKVYAGWYRGFEGPRVPVVHIVKCGSPEEANDTKPGNRGKRDSQIILMQFLAKVIFDDRMTPLEYEIFHKIQLVTGKTADVYEVVLMVDADTKVMPDALKRMVTCMAQDPLIMGLCGETRIANKAASWVTMIQVFEYYISHHLAKAFESVFGGVTCLPGCFCMYRIKAPKGPPGSYVPILASPDIVASYSENVVDTLHKKNLLLLGEDRYLTTLMLRNFPKRKMMFVPAAVCKTVVPDTFRVLLSQRRRWINSTIHNLLELVLVRDLCGIFCFSMQFVIAIELIGTVVLPAAISFTIYLLILTCVSTQTPVLPLILLAIILGLPAILIVCTSRRLVYLPWMLIYICALPIWNFVLPVYAFWHFDDFSWGQTRSVDGDSSHDTSASDGNFDPSKIMMRSWREWDRTDKASARSIRSLA